MSKLQGAASTTINALGTVFAAAVTAGSGAFAAITAQKVAQSGDLNAIAIPVTAAFMTVAWGAMTTVAAKSTNKEFKSLLQSGSSSQQQPEPGA